MVLTPQELNEISQNKIKRRNQKSGDNPKILIIAQVLKFIPTSKDGDPIDFELKVFLVLNKQSSAVLQKQVYKQALIYEIDKNKLTKKRIFLWKKLLRVDSDSKDYYAFRDKVNCQDKNITFEDDGEVYQA